MKIAELKLNKIRKIITVEIENEEKIITIYNPIGIQRKDLISSINEISSKNIDDEIKKSEIYKLVVERLTDVKVNTKNFKDIENNPHVAFLDMNNSIMDIIYELQLEYLYEAKRGLNEQTIKALTTLNIKKAKELTDLMNEVL